MNIGDRTHDPYPITLLLTPIPHLVECNSWESNLQPLSNYTTLTLILHLADCSHRGIEPVNLAHYTTLTPTLSPPQVLPLPVHPLPAQQSEGHGGPAGQLRGHPDELPGLRGNKAAAHQGDPEEAVQGDHDGTGESWAPVGRGGEGEGWGGPNRKSLTLLGIRIFKTKSGANYPAMFLGHVNSTWVKRCPDK